MPGIVRLQAFGGPEVLRLDEVAIINPGPGEVRIRVGAFGLNRVEAMYRSGGFGPASFPALIGYEAAGVIEATGSGVSGFSPGDRVAVLPGLSMAEYGTNGEVILYRADMLVKLPDSQSLSDAAASWMQYLTAYALVAAARIAAGDHVVITAASSSVGLAAIQVARHAGAIPIAVTRGRSKAEALRKHGAAHVIVSDEEDVTAHILDISGGQGARIAFDAVGGPMLPLLAMGLSPGGIVILYGSLAGDDVSLPAHLLMLRNLSLRGFSANALVENPATRQAALAYISEGLASGALHPVIDRRFPLEQIVEAHRYLEGNSQIGKIIVTTRTADE